VVVFVHLTQIVDHDDAWRSGFVVSPFDGIR
jgi:hypothetical protein